MKTNGYTKVNEDDDIDEFQFNEVDYDGHDNNEIKEEENTSN